MDLSIWRGIFDDRRDRVNGVLICQSIGGFVETDDRPSRSPSSSSQYQRQVTGLTGDISSTMDDHSGGLCPGPYPVPDSLRGQWLMKWNTSLSFQWFRRRLLYFKPFQGSNLTLEWKVHHHSSMFCLDSTLDTGVWIWTVWWPIHHHFIVNMNLSLIIFCNRLGNLVGVCVMFVFWVLVVSALGMRWVWLAWLIRGSINKSSDATKAIIYSSTATTAEDTWAMRRWIYAWWWWTD